VTATALVAGLARGHAQGRLEQRLVTFVKPELLIIDELGYLPLQPDAAHLLFQLVSRRYERGAILLTSNRSVGEWGAVFGDPVVATAILDRLLHHSHVITIRGDSYRMHEKRRRGLRRLRSTTRRRRNPRPTPSRDESRVEEGRGGLRLGQSLRFPSPSRPGEFHPEPLSRVGSRRGPGFG